MNVKRIAALSAAAFALLYSVGILWGMPSEFVPEIDSEFPTGPFNVLLHLRDAGYTSVYPAFHKLLMLPLYAILFLIFKMTGQISLLSTAWPYGFRDAPSAMTAMIVAARSVSLCMGAGTLCVLFLIVNRLSEGLGMKKRLLVLSPAAAFGLSGVVTYYSRVSNPDAPQLFWWSLSFFFLWHWMTAKAARKKTLVLSALFAALAAATKDQAITFVAGSSLLLLFFPPGKNLSGRRAITFVSYVLCAAGFYAAAAVLIQPAHWLNHVKQVFFVNVTSGQFAVHSGSFTGQIALALESMRCLSHILSPWGIFFSAAGAALIIYKKKYMFLSAVGFPLIAVLAFAKTHFIFERYLLNVSFLLALASAYGIRLALAEHPARILAYVRPALPVAAACWLLHQFFFGFIPVTYAQLSDTKRQLSRTMPAFVPAGDTIRWHGSRFSLPNAQAYSRCRFALPDDDFDSLRSSRMKRVLVRSNEECDWVLADRDLLMKDSTPDIVNRLNRIDTAGLQLMVKIEDPEFVRKNIRVYSVAHRLMTFRISIPYYLYRRNAH